MRKDLKDKELSFLFGEYKVDPSLFVKNEFVEDAEALRPFGIHIPRKNEFPRGFIKLMPQDFIVEEIDPQGTISTVTLENTTVPESAGENPTIFATLVKCGISTIEAVHDIAKQIGCETTQIQYAGIKDKDALTSQRVSFRGVSLDALRTISSPYFFLKNFSVGKGVVEKGNLQGNRFTILVRTDHTIEERQNVFVEQLGHVQEKGFYNFYYLQRFGTPRLINYWWALLILKGRYQEAVEHYLSYEAPREIPYFRNLRKKIKGIFPRAGEIRKLLEPLPVVFHNEHKILDYLITHPSDYKGALAQIPDQIMLWVYALSSLLFNEKLSSFIELEKDPPRTLPLFLSNVRDDVELYRDLLQSADIYPPPFYNLRPFPNIRLMHRFAPTIEAVEVHATNVLREGIVLQFSLGKGEYATTFLSHLFNLVSDKVPEGISKDPVDVKAALSDTPLNVTVEHFKSVIHSKGNNIFETYSEQN